MHAPVQLYLIALLCAIISPSAKNATGKYPGFEGVWNRSGEAFVPAAISLSLQSPSTMFLVPVRMAVPGYPAGAMTSGIFIIG
jgi:hypothetical protein